MNDVVPTQSGQAVDDGGLGEFIAAIMAMTHAEALPVLGARLDAITADALNEPIGLLLQGLHAHFMSLRALEEGRFDMSMEMASRAAMLFAGTELDELAALAKGIATYSTAVIEVQRLNITTAGHLLTQMEAELQKAGAFGQRFQVLIDHTKPEQIYVSAVQPLLSLDLSTARVIIGQASAAAEKVAERYYAHGDQGYCLFMGMASLFRANYHFVESNKSIAELDLNVALDRDMTKDARRACEFLSKADLSNVQVKAQLEMARCFVEMSDVTQQLAASLLRCFTAKFKPDPSSLAKLRQSAQRAVDHAERIGPNGIVFVRAGQSMQERIRNLERLARPSKADFGVYSGLIAIALFVVLFAAGIWARNQFGLDLEPRLVLWSSIAMALIGGFGLGAIRFRSMFV